MSSIRRLVGAGLSVLAIRDEVLLDVGVEFVGQFLRRVGIRHLYDPILPDNVRASAAQKQCPGSCLGSRSR